MATRRLNLGIFILDDDRLELAMRQSMKENNNVRRSLDLSPFGMSEDDQVHHLLRGLSIREYFDIVAIPHSVTSIR